MSLGAALVVLASLASPATVPPPPHDLHVCYGNVAVEGRLVVARIRFFKDDLEAALRMHGAPADFVLSASPTADALFMDYFGERFSVEVAGRRLAGRLVGSGEDALDREPVWWYAVEFEAPGAGPPPGAGFRLGNSLLLELFGDQRNVVKVVRFPDEAQRTYAFARGEEVVEVALPPLR